MHKLDELKGEIRRTIQESDEYKEYKKLETEINKDPELKRAVDQLRRENFELKYTDSLEESLSKSEQLSRKFAQVSQQNAVNRYLLSEICLCRLIQELCMSVVESVDFDTDFLLN